MSKPQYYLMLLGRWLAGVLKLLFKVCALGTILWATILGLAAITGFNPLAWSACAMLINAWYILWFVFRMHKLNVPKHLVMWLWILTFIDAGVVFVILFVAYLFGI